MRFSIFINKYVKPFNFYTRYQFLWQWIFRFLFIKPFSSSLKNPSLGARNGSEMCYQCDLSPAASTASLSKSSTGADGSVFSCSPLFESSAAWFYYYESDVPPRIRNDKPLGPIQEAFERGAKTLKGVNNSVLELNLVHMLKLKFV